MAEKAEFGNFSQVAKAYVGRPQYSPRLLDMLHKMITCREKSISFADIGAGTGPIAKALVERGLSGYAIEPDTSMVQVGQQNCNQTDNLQWVVGSGEHTKLPDQSIDWICYSGSFHWTDQRNALLEAKRILKDCGFLSILYHLMDVQNDPFNIEVENRVRSMQPALRRARPPILGQMDTFETLLADHPDFGNCVFLSTTEKLCLSKKQYIEYWAGSHDMPSQMNDDEWKDILSMIDTLYEERSPERIRFRSWAWHSKTTQ